MSIVHTADVFCDAPDCNQWTHGACEDRPPKHSTARANASKEGWRRIGFKDYCPSCVQELGLKKESK